MSKAETRVINGREVERGSTNVDADLGFLDAEEMLVKSNLVFKIDETLCSMGLTQIEAAKILGLTQPKLRGSFGDISTAPSASSSIA